jgi:RNA recognition motif-containing protein
LNIHVANLPREYDETKVRALFAAHGAVSSVKLDIDRITGHHSGFCFVEMPNDDEAKAAIAALHGKKLTDYPLSLKEVPPEEESHGSEGQKGKSRRGGKGGPKGGAKGGGFHATSGFQGGAPRRGGQRGA